MMGNTVRAENGTEVYKEKVLEIADEYTAETFPDCEEDEIKMLMRKSQPFKGMLKYINNRLFKLKDGDIKYNNKNSNIDYSDIDYINRLWDIYTSLCYRYLQNPTILNFSLFTGIDMDTFNCWKTGENRGGIDGASSVHAESYKKWLAECEGALYDTAMTGNPGAMFLLKSNYGYTETPQRIEITGSNAPALSQEDIRQIADQARKESLPELIEGLPDE